MTRLGHRRTLDTLARSVAVPHVEVGDLMVVFQSGAYARAASPLGFLSHPSPPEVMAHNGQTRLIRKRGGPSDYLRDIQFACEPLAARQDG